VVDLTAFAHNRAFLVWILFGLALLQTDRAASLDSSCLHGLHREQTGDETALHVERPAPVHAVTDDGAVPRVVRPPIDGPRGNHVDMAVQDE